jgi:hypothetical protein
MIIVLGFTKDCHAAGSDGERPAVIRVQKHYFHLEILFNFVAPIQQF